MAKYCAGIKINPQDLKIIDGIITMASETVVSADTAISTCGQLWDSKHFSKTTINGHPCVTLVTENDYEWLDDPVFIRGNCGVGLDGRVFKLDYGVVSFVNHYVLTVIPNPIDATVVVTDADGRAIPDASGGQYALSDIGAEYTIAVSKTGYTSQSKTIKNIGNQVITITLVEE